MVIYGKNAVLENLKAKKAVFKLFISQSFREDKENEIIWLARKSNIDIQFVDKKELDKLSQEGHHQGYVAQVEDFVYSEVEDILAFANQKGEQPFLVILDGIEDPHNLGSVLRVCECAGVHGVIIPKHRACSINETVFKTSAGAGTYVKVAKVTNLNQTIEKLKKEGIWVYAVELGGQNIYAQNLQGSIALVIGSEGKGVSQLTRKICDDVLTLPMFGKINSLNASVACGISVFEVIRQRRYK